MKLRLNESLVGRMLGVSKGRCIVYKSPNGRLWIGTTASLGLMPSATVEDLIRAIASELERQNIHYGYLYSTAPKEDAVCVDFVCVRHPLLKTE